MKHSVVREDVRKKRLESPWRPTVPGPVASARMLTREKVPLMMPKPKPETIKLNIITGVGRVQFNVITISQDVFIGNDGSV